MAFGKRGISPLIATVLLISFSVALGAVVMSWGQTYIAQKAEFATGVQEYSSGCAQAEISILTVRDTPRVCYRFGQVEIYINNGPVELSGIKASVIGDKDVSNVENALASPLAAQSVASLKLAFDSGLGVLQQVKLTPKADATLCAAKTIIAESIPPCP